MRAFDLRKAQQLMKLLIRFGLFVVIAVSALGEAPESYADRGVGVTLGIIAVDERLKGGGGYNLPKLGIINTGDEPGEYEVVISYLQGQREMRPASDWFSFQPQRFFLNADEARDVNIRLTLPTGVKPGDYFAFIEAHPVAQEQGITIGAAAATKLSFTVKPSGWIEAQRTNFNRIVDENEPWSYLLPASTLGALLFYMMGRSYRLRSPLERRR